MSRTAGHALTWCAPGRAGQANDPTHIDRLETLPGLLVMTRRLAAAVACEIRPPPANRRCQQVDARDRSRCVENAYGSAIGPKCPGDLAGRRGSSALVKLVCVRTDDDEYE